MFLPLIWPSGITFWLARDLSFKKGKNYRNASVLPLSCSPLPLLFLSAKTLRSRFTGSKVTGPDTRPLQRVCVRCSSCLNMCVCNHACRICGCCQSPAYCATSRYFAKDRRGDDTRWGVFSQHRGLFLGLGLHKCTNRELTVKWVRLCHAASVNKQSGGPP